MTKPTIKKPAVKKPAVVPGANVSTIRLDQHVRLALAKAAENDRRSSSALLRIILEDWLKERGYLKKEAGGLVYCADVEGEVPRWQSKKSSDD